MKTLYRDDRIWVVTKPPGVLSTDEPGGMPALLRAQLGDEKACIRTVHRLDAAVGGVMVFARSRVAASLLSEQMREHSFEKTYLAVVHGVPPAAEGIFTDLLGYDRERRLAYVAPEPGKEIRPARLSYRLLGKWGSLSLVAVRLHTGRTHQIRIQFASRGLPLWGDRKYGKGEPGHIALWSYQLGFDHPQTGQRLTFSAPPPDALPWQEFQNMIEVSFP